MCKHNTGSSRELGGVLMLEWVIDLKMVRQKDWSENDWKSSQCPKENFKNTSREPGGVLLKNILRNYKKVYFFASKGWRNERWFKTFTQYCTVSFLPTCPEEANRLMVVRSIQPRLASSLWFTSRNWTMARLAASGKTITHTNVWLTGWKVTAHCGADGLFE